MSKRVSLVAGDAVPDLHRTAILVVDLAGVYGGYSELGSKYRDFRRICMRSFSCSREISCFRFRLVYRITR